MYNKKNRLINKQIIIIDIALFFVVWLFVSEHAWHNTISYKTYISIFAIYIAFYLFFNSIYDAYAVGRRKITENAYSLTLSCVISSVLFYILDTLAFRKFFSPLYLLVAFLVQGVINLLWCKIAHDRFIKNYKAKKAIVIYKTEYDLSKINNIPFFDVKYNIKKSIKNPRSYKELSKEIEKYEVVFIAGVNATIRNGIVKECVSKGIEAFVIPHVGDVIVTGGKYVEELPVPMVNVSKRELDPIYEILKRAFDIIVASIALIVLCPFWLITALAIKLYDNGPILYKQTRLTKDRREFVIYKFRSMKVDAEKDGVARLVSEHDNRITPIGKIIRAIRFDEIPQILNILKGDMSIVGPRPERPEIAQQYEKAYPSFALRLQVKAGLTGYAQIYGKYNTEPIDKLKMDLYYINKMSFLYDIQLCFMTVKTLFMKDSTAAIKEGSITASKSRDSE